MKIGDLVRFMHEQNGGPIHRVVSVMSDGMIELHDMGGYFAPHLFVPTDVGEMARAWGLIIIEHDGFAGTPIGYYERVDGKRGAVLQMIGTGVVHVYGEKWFDPAVFAEIVKRFKPAAPAPEDRSDG